MGALGVGTTVIGVEDYLGSNVVGCVFAVSRGFSASIAVGCHCCNTTPPGDLGERTFATALLQIMFRGETDESKKRPSDHGIKDALLKYAGGVDMYSI